MFDARMGLRPYEGSQMLIYVLKQSQTTSSWAEQQEGGLGVNSKARPTGSMGCLLRAQLVPAHSEMPAGPGMPAARVPAAEEQDDEGVNSSWPSKPAAAKSAEAMQQRGTAHSLQGGTEKLNSKDGSSTICPHGSLY